MAWDPAIRVPRTILSSWLDLWRGLKPKEQALARAVWDKHKIKFQAYNGTHRWNMVSGPIATAVATLMDLGWNPDRPDRWISPGGDTWRVTRGAGPANVLDELSRSAEAKAWSRASSHYHGVGLEHGGDLVGLKRQLATLHKHGHHKTAAILGMVAAGGEWTGTRLNGSYPDIDPTCKRCGAAEDAAFHRHYGCQCCVPQPDDARPDIEEYRQEFLQLAAEASQQAELQPALWYRGTNDSSSIPIPAPATPLMWK